MTGLRKQKAAIEKEAQRYSEAVYFILRNVDNLEAKLLGGQPLDKQDIVKDVARIKRITSMTMDGYDINKIAQVLQESE